MTCVSTLETLVCYHLRLWAVIDCPGQRGFSPRSEAGDSFLQPSCAQQDKCEATSSDSEPEADFVPGTKSASSARSGFAFLLPSGATISSRRILLSYQCISCFFRRTRYARTFFQNVPTSRRSTMPTVLHYRFRTSSCTGRATEFTSGS